MARAAAFGVVLAAAVFGALQLTDVDPAPLEFPPLRPLPPLDGPDATELVTVERLFEGDEAGFKGPESFVFNDDGSVYTGLADGRIVRLVLGEGEGEPRYEEVARTGEKHEDCGALALEPLCGRPLGLRAEGNGSLLVADAYKGLLRVTPATPAAGVGADAEATVETLVDSALEGLTLVNDLEWDGTRRVVYFSNTGRFPRNEIHRMLIESRPTGKLMRYELDTRKLSVLADGLVMPNGIAMTNDGSALLVCSTATSSLYKIDLDGEGHAVGGLGGARVVQNDLQGGPDNIRRRHGKDTFLVGLGSKRAAPFSLVQLLSPFLTLRKLMSLVDLETSTALIPKAGLVVEVDADGQVLHLFQDPRLNAYWVSEAEEHGGYMYLGSWRTSFLARAKL